MLAAVVEHFLDHASEREFVAPFIALLLKLGFGDVGRSVLSQRNLSVAKSDMPDRLRFAERATPLMEIAHHQATVTLPVTVPPDAIRHNDSYDSRAGLHHCGRTERNARGSAGGDCVTGPGEHLVVRSSPVCA
jgi:hypothetical protein